MISSILFRVDGGNIYSVAMGHVYRCVRLARQLSANGIDCRFLMKNYHEGISVVENAGFPVKVMDAAVSDKSEAELAVSQALTNNAPLFIDLRSAKKHLVDLANARNLATIVYEDHCAESLQPTMLINPSFAAQTERRYNSKMTEYLLGMNYLILNPLVDSRKRDKFSRRVDTLFVNFGGADPCNLSSRVIDILLYRNDSYKINLALGPAFRHQEELEEIIANKDINGRIRLIIGCNELPALIAQSDAAITAGGTMVYEAIGVCVPVFVLPSINSEAQTASILIERELAAGFEKDVVNVSDVALGDAIHHFIFDEEIREVIYNAQKQSCFSGGLERVGRYLMNIN